MPVSRSRSEDTARFRARRRAEGMASIEAVLHRDEIASLDKIKARLGVASRSEVLRMMIAKVGPNSLTPADAAVLEKRSA